jgi:hypothetical protein
MKLIITRAVRTKDFRTKILRKSANRKIFVRTNTTGKGVVRTKFVKIKVTVAFIL